MLPLSSMHPTSVKRVMISSTARDLPEHRMQVLDACLRQGMFPLMMEHLPASDADAITASLKLVDEADLYLGIFAYRYGHIPKDHNISITEMEYNRAVERGIPCLIFLMHEKHPLTAADVDKGEDADKLEELKARLQAERVVNYFESPEKLWGLVINSLSNYRETTHTAFHYVSSIPTAPEPYVAHPYTLLQTPTLIGRQEELKRLTDWVANPNSDMYQARILSIVAIGGMGKSALTWTWFENIAPQKMQPLAGRIWWSFYESDATFENFVLRSLGYVNKQPIENIQKLPLMEREAELLAILDREPYLVVLDGLERLLVAYARMDAARLMDEDLDQRTANPITHAHGWSGSTDQSLVTQHPLRETADIRVGMFLRKLAKVQSSRILISTRLLPANLQTVTGDDLPGCRNIMLKGLADDDAFALWSTFKIKAFKEKILPFLRTFECHPLLIQALAGAVAHDPQAFKDFDRWQLLHPKFDPFQLRLVQVQKHVLDYALTGLEPSTQYLLYTLAAFRMPATYNTLAALLVGRQRFFREKLFRSEDRLIGALNDLEDRGLLGWDQRANRYDLHPVVRGVAWSILNQQKRSDVYRMLSQYFASLPHLNQLFNVTCLEDLTPAIEWFNALIGRERYEEALNIFDDHLHQALFYLLGAYQQQIELLEQFFPNGLDQPPHLSSRADQAFVLHGLAVSHREEPRLQVVFFQRSIDVWQHMYDGQSRMNSWLGLSNLSDSLRLSGFLYKSMWTVLEALSSIRDGWNISNVSQDAEAVNLYWLGLVLAVRGKYEQSKQALERSLKLVQSVHRAYDCQSQCALLHGVFTEAQDKANEAMAYAQKHGAKHSIIRALRLQGEAALGLKNISVAEDRLHLALAQARKMNIVEEELPTWVALAELRRQQGKLKEAQETLEEIWESAEHGPFRLILADSYNVLAQIKRDASEGAAAAQAAIKAYRLAWCDGPPFAYQRGLQQAHTHLVALLTLEPKLQPFDASKHDPLPKFTINPPKEFRE